MDEVPGGGRHGLAEGLIRRGDVVIVAMSREYGKPRPAIVVQSDVYASHPSFVVCPVTTELRDDAPVLRPAIAPTAENGLDRASQVMVDKIGVVDRQRIGKVIGRADAGLMSTLGAALSALLDLA